MWHGRHVLSTHVGDDGQVRQGFQDIEPYSDVLGTLSDWPAVVTHKLVRIQTDFHPVVEEGEERREWERCHKDGDEPKLENCSTRTHFQTCAIKNDRQSKLILLFFTYVHIII